MLKKQTMKLYLKENLTLYVFVSVLFVVGVIFGAVMVNALSLEQKQDMSRHLGSFFNPLTTGPHWMEKTPFSNFWDAHKVGPPNLGIRSFYYWASFDFDS
nr:hypothetical protein [Paenibacillus larvae]